MMISRWKQPFLYLSGTDLKTAEQCPPDLVTRYTLLGVLVCIPALMAFISSSYAISLIFPNQKFTWAIAAAWSFVILTIDRCIVAYNPPVYDEDSVFTYSERSQFLRSLWMPLSRVILSILLGVIVAEPLCAGFFQDTIKEELNDERTKKADEAEKPLDSIIQQENARIDAAKALWRAKQDSATAESNGTGGSHRRNIGPIYEREKKDADSLRSEYHRISIVRGKNIDSLKAKIAMVRKDVEEQQAVGLLGRIEALHTAAARNRTLWMSLWWLRAFLVAIELIPLILKNSLKRKSDAYVMIAHHNNTVIIKLNKGEENNIARSRHGLYLQDENERIEQVIRQKSIARAERDFEFFFKISQDATAHYGKESLRMEQMVRDNLTRTEVVGELLTAYNVFRKRIMDIYKQDNEQDK